MYHTLPDMELCGAANSAHALRETARIIKQYLVFADMEKYRRIASQVRIKWRGLRIKGIPFT